MRASTRWRAAAAILLVLTPLVWAQAPPGEWREPAALPLAFEANHGQARPEVRFLLRAGECTVFLTRKTVTMACPEAATAARMSLRGASRSLRLEGLEELPAKTNYFAGRDPRKWFTGIPNYAKVRYRGVYRGIDLVFRVSGRQLEYDWVLAPGADAAAIRIAWKGVESLRLDEQGDLVVAWGGHLLRHRRPVIYQRAAGGLRHVPGAHRLIGTRLTGFRVGPYDTGAVLTIDPVLSWATRLGGSGYSTHFLHLVRDRGDGIAADGAGNVYVVGKTGSTDYPAGDFTRIGPRTGQLFVVKLNPAGSVVYTTLLGGAYPGVPYPGVTFVGGANSIAVDGQGYVYLTGGADTSLPLVNPLFSQGGTFLAKLDPSGSRLAYSTFLGGGGGVGVALDSTGSVWVAGVTRSQDIPVTSGAFQSTFGGGESNGFLMKINAAGSAVLYSTYLGGKYGVTVRGVAVDASGAACVAGSTYLDFPTTPGAIQSRPPGSTDGFVFKVSSNGAPIYSTFLGGSGIDTIFGIATDAYGNCYVAGGTDSGDFGFPITPGVYQPRPDAPIGSRIGFVTKLNSIGTALGYSTYFPTLVTSIALDGEGNAYLAGTTDSLRFPLVKPVQGYTSGGQCSRDSDGALMPCTDAFLAKLSADGSRLLWSTYLGGSHYEETTAIAARQGNVYLTGVTASKNFPATIAPANPEASVMVARISEAADAPVFSPASITNGASFVSGLTPGGIATIFGYGFAAADGISAASRFPLPKVLAGVSVRVNGVDAPLLAVARQGSAEQINFIVPNETAGQTTATVVVVRDGVPSIPVPVLPLAEQPGLFSADGVNAVAQHGADYQLVTSASPARRGEIIVLYATGLGAVQPAVPTGAPAPDRPLSSTVTVPAVSLGGVPAEVLFSGLTPGYAGLYQVNFRVPLAVGSGEQDVIVRVADQISKIVRLFVE